MDWSYRRWYGRRVVRSLIVVLGFLACTATSRPLSPGPAATLFLPVTEAPSIGGDSSGQRSPQAPDSSFATRLDALATWLEGQPGVERVAGWTNGEHYVWVRDDAGSTWCWKDERCWTGPERPALISVLLAVDGPRSPEALRLAWGPENGVVAVWEFDFAAGQRRRIGEVVARSSEPLPFWWATGQAELSVPGERGTMPTTAPPVFLALGFEPGGLPEAAIASPTIAAPQWLPLLADLEIWPYRTSTGVAAFAVMASGRGASPIGSCVRLDRWRCALLERPERRADGRAPVRAELVGTAAVALEIAELDGLEQEGEYGELELGGFSARAELHVLAVDANAGRLAPVGAVTLGGAVGTVASLGMYRSTVDLDYRFVRRAYQRWTAAGGCIRVDALRGEDVALNDEFEPLSDLLARQWRINGGRMPKPRKPVRVDPEAARAVIANAAVLGPDSRGVDANAELEGAWQVVDGRLVRAGPEGCAP